MANGTNDIIIKGGSAEIIFNDEVYKPDSEAPHTYANAQRKIVRVVITGDIEYDSGGEKPDGLKCKIVISCR
jgi:hypothetical protein